MTFPADGVTLNFLGWENWRVSRPHCVILSPDQSGGSMSHPAVLSCREKFVAGLASERQRRSVQTSTQFCFCSSVNILGTQRADTLFMPKSSGTIRCTVVSWMSVVSTICRIVRRLSSFNMPLAIWTFSVLAASLGQGCGLLWSRSRRLGLETVSRRINVSSRPRPLTSRARDQFSAEFCRSL